MSKTAPNRLYLIPVLSKALDVLQLLEAQNHPQTVEEIYQRTNISKTTVYRILKTLVHRGYVAQAENGGYRLVSKPRKVKFGFGGESAEMPFSEAVKESLKAAASSAGVDLVVLDNRYDAATAVQNANEFVKARVDLVIEFQIDQHIAPVVAEIISGAGIPLVAVDIPHPHATFFGVNNYQVGFEAGKYLAHHAKRQWGGKIRWFVGLDIESAGPLVQSRTAGAFAGVRANLPGLHPDVFVTLHGEGLRDRSYELTRQFLRAHSDDRGILIAAATDTSALGALQAVRELKRGRNVAIVGQDCIPEALEEIRKPGSPFIGSVSHEAASYGPRLIQIGLALLNGQTVPPYNYIRHKLVTAASLRKTGHLTNTTAARRTG